MSGKTVKVLILVSAVIATVVGFFVCRHLGGYWDILSFVLPFLCFLFVYFSGFILDAEMWSKVLAILRSEELWQPKTGFGILAYVLFPLLIWGLAWLCHPFIGEDGAIIGYAVFVFLWAHFYSGPELKKEYVDLIYYSFGILAVALFFLVGGKAREEILVAGEIRRYETEIEELKSKISFFNAVSEHPRDAASYFISNMGLAVGTSLNSEFPGYNEAYAGWQTLKAELMGSLDPLNVLLESPRQKSLANGNIPNGPVTLTYQDYSIEIAEFLELIKSAINRDGEIAKEIALTRNEVSAAFKKISDAEAKLKELNSNVEDSGGWLPYTLRFNWPYIVILLISMKIARKNLAALKGEI